ncbi:MAG TPA: hypothetical protein DCY57_09775 [Bacteroidetes bacterium]|nr:hypothetical protein [Bacteroidota bacterium]
MTTLGDVVQGLASSEVEDSRLANLIADNSSLQFEVLRDHHRGKFFNDLCKSKPLVKKIHGFRPTSEKYKQLVFEDVMKEFRDQSPSKQYWILYRTSVVEHLRAEAAELNKLLSSVEVQGGQLSGTAEIMESIASRALEFNVVPAQVEMLYELWHFDRMESFDEYIRRFPKPDVQEVFELRISELRHEIQERFEPISSKLRQMDESFAQTVSDVQALEKKLAVDFLGKLETVSADVSSVFEALKSLENEQSKSLEQVQLETTAEFTILQGAITKLTEGVSSLLENDPTISIKSELESVSQLLSRLEEDLNDVKVSMPTGSGIESVDLEVGAGPRLERDFAVVLRHRASNTIEHSDTSRSHDFALELFNATLDEADRNSAQSLVAFNTLLRMNCFVCTSYSSYRDWLNSVGWTDQVTTVCAAPNWIDQGILTDHFSWLVDRREEVRSLIILDFDLGYVEGYLIPLLKLLLFSSAVGPEKKVALVPSTSDWLAPASLFHVSGVMPELKRTGIEVGSVAEAGLDLSSLIENQLFSGALEERISSEMLDRNLGSQHDRDVGPQLSKQQKQVVYASGDSPEQVELIVEWLQKTIARHCKQ